MSKGNFLGGNFVAKDMEMCIGNLTIPYSFFNVSTFYNNQTFSFTFPTGATTTTLSIFLTAGFSCSITCAIIGFPLNSIKPLSSPMRELFPPASIYPLIDGELFFITPNQLAISLNEAMTNTTASTFFKTVESNFFAPK